jgi:hypothetical protein
MIRHHPACPDGPHVHAVSPLLVRFDGYAVFVDRDTAVLTTERHVAERIAELINTHGLADVPDHLPDDLVWGPPASDPIVDWRLPTNPTIQENHP